jgi:hypothetical protein
MSIPSLRFSGQCFSQITRPGHSAASTPQPTDSPPSGTDRFEASSETRSDAANLASLPVEVMTLILEKLKLDQQDNYARFEALHAL